MQTQIFDAEELSREAEFLHDRIFGRPIPEAIRQGYVSANKLLLTDAKDLSVVSIEPILQRSMDVEAIEFVLRRRTANNTLTKKFQILCYLAESRSDYFSTFVNDEHQPFKAFLELLRYTLRSFYKLLKGHCLIWMYDVV